MELQADSPQRLRSRQDGAHSIVDAAQFAESMVPEGLHGTALPRNSSQTSLSGAAPGGVLDTGPHSAALPRSSSQASLPRVVSSSALYIGPHGKALPRNASSSSLVGAGPRSAPHEADQGHVQRAQGSNFRWPWQAKKPGGAVRQLQPSHQSSGARTHPSVIPHAVTQAAEIAQGTSAAPSQLGFSNQTGSAMANSASCQRLAGRAGLEQDEPRDDDHTRDSDQPRDEARREAASSYGMTRSTSKQAHGLADKALDKIAAAQQKMHQAEPVLDASFWMKSNAGSPGSPESGAFSQPSSPQHNSRPRACTKSDRLRQLIKNGSLQRQRPDYKLGSTEAPESRGRATQGLLQQPSSSSAALADDSTQAKGRALETREQEHHLRDTKGDAEQPLRQGRKDEPEGPQHAGNPGSQAAALDSNADSAEAHR